MKEQVIQIDEKNQVRIRLNEWKGEVKVYLQNFFTPGPTSKFPTGPDGYAFGKAVTLPPERFAEFLDKAYAFAKDNQLVHKEKTKKIKVGMAQRTPSDDVDEDI